jgi:hypothetical protein
MAVSNDGKYLAVMNEGISKLMVWSLDTRQKIVDKYIATDNYKFSDPADVKFSELNTDKIYFTGQFYQGSNNGLFGLCIFSISQNRIIDSTFATVEDIDDRIYNEGFTFFDNETKILGGGGPFVKIVNLISMAMEFQRHYQEGDTVYPGNSVYSSKHKFFIGYATKTINKFIYQPNTIVTENNPNVVVYPNPTTGIVNIPMNCVNTSKYEIFDTGGRLLSSSEITNTANNILTIDFTQYPVGVYSVKIYCGKAIEQYQVVRGE